MFTNQIFKEFFRVPIVESNMLNGFLTLGIELITHM